jgi:hypothetical protein
MQMCALSRNVPPVPVRITWLLRRTVLFHSNRQSRDFSLPPENPINREKNIAAKKARA